MKRLLLICASLCMAAIAAAQDYPSKPIRFITPYPPGGTTTLLSRLVGQKLTDSWGQPVIVENRPGGNTIIGTEAAAKSPPDGYTILLAASSHILSPLLLPRLPYDTIKDFTAIATLASTEQLLVLHPTLAANNLREFIALAKSRPGQLNYASTGSGGIQHLASEFFNILAGVRLQHIPYKGSGPALIDLIGGQIQVYFAPPINAIPHVKGGKLRAIAVSGESRLSALPQVPTFSQAGLAGFDVRTYSGVVAPAGTPQAIVTKLATEIARILAAHDVRDSLASQGMDTFINGPEQYAALMKADMAKFAKVIKTANIKLDE